MPTLSDYLEYKHERMTALRDRLREPGVGPFPLLATCRVAGGSGVRPVRVREFTIVTDSSPALAGYDLGPTAPELLLSSLASCLAHTFLIVAANRNLTYRSLEVAVQADIDFRGVLEVDPQAPTMPQDLRYTATIDCDLDLETLTAVQAEVERLCPVLQAIVRPLAVSGELRRVEV